MQQAVANLLDNAIKFSPDGGVVSLQGGRTPTGTVPAMLHLRVIDAGPGIPANDVSRATKRFFRGETARHTPGFGLGLTLVRAVAQLHGGTLSLEQARPGLRATLALPVVEEEASGRRALPPEGQHEDVPVGGA